MNPLDKRAIERALHQEGFTRNDAKFATAVIARTLAGTLETKSLPEHPMSADMQDILTAVEASNKALDEFKARTNAQIQALESREAKTWNRPGNGSIDLEGGGTAPRKQVYDTPEAKAFSAYFRKGIESRELKAMDWSNPSEGGYGLPKEISAQVESLLLKYSAMRRLSTVVQTTTSDFHHLVADTKQTGSAWVGEMAARPATNTPTFFDVQPPMGELYANPQITQQALDDLVFNAEQFLVDAIVATFTSAEGQAFVLGTGVNQPKGLLTYPTAATDDSVRAVGTVQYVPSGAAAGFLATTASVSAFDCLQAAYFALRAPYRADAAWLANSATMALLAGVRDTQGRYLLAPPTQGFPPTILGLPVYEDQWMPAIGANAYPIALVSRRAYLIADRLPIRSIRDNLTNKPYVGMFTTKRVAGGLLNSEAVKLVKVSIS